MGDAEVEEGASTLVHCWQHAEQDTGAITDYPSVEVAEENVRTWENICDVMISEKKRRLQNRT